MEIGTKMTLNIWFINYKNSSNNYWADLSKTMVNVKKKKGISEPRVILQVVDDVL